MKRPDVFEVEQSSAKCLSPPPPHQSGSQSSDIRSSALSSSSLCLSLSLQSPLVFYIPGRDKITPMAIDDTKFAAAAKATEAKEDIERGGEDEPVPSYEAATSSSAGAQTSASSMAVDGRAPAATTNIYPFPSSGSSTTTATAQYGESPYQPQGTVRIAIVPSSFQGLQGQGQALPTHLIHLQPDNHYARRARGRFCSAFFFAIVLYAILSMSISAVWYQNEGPGSLPPPRHGDHNHGGHGHGHGRIDDAGAEQPRIGSTHNTLWDSIVPYTSWNLLGAQDWRLFGHISPSESISRNSESTSI